VICARLERPDLILVDVVLPETDGYELCRELRGDRAVRHIPLIAVAANTRTETEPLWARMQGASDFVDAAYTAEQLLSAIRTALI
jgi:CheY-like chemotaxis protein